MNFTGISKMERKEKNCENVEVKRCVLQNLLEKFKREKKIQKIKTNKKKDRQTWGSE